MDINVLNLRKKNYLAMGIFDCLTSIRLTPCSQLIVQVAKKRALKVFFYFVCIYFNVLIENI